MVNGADDLSQKYLMSGMMISSRAQNFTYHPLRREIQAHHLLTNQAEQGTIEVPEKLLQSRQKEKTHAKSEGSKTI